MFVVWCGVALAVFACWKWERTRQERAEAKRVADHEEEIRRAERQAEYADALEKYRAGRKAEKRAWRILQSQDLRRRE